MACERVLHDHDISLWQLHCCTALQLCFCHALMCTCLAQTLSTVCTLHSAEDYFAHSQAGQEARRCHRCRGAGAP